MDMKHSDDRREVTITCNSVSSEALLGVRREMVIRHNGEDYRLRITANDKLILTK